jgi:hypothetical protein
MNSGGLRPPVVSGVDDMIGDDLILNKKARWDKVLKNPEPIPECVRCSECPKCGHKRMHLERIPFTRPDLYDVACICGCRIPLPEGYHGDGCE